MKKKISVPKNKNTKKKKKKKKFQFRKSEATYTFKNGGYTCLWNPDWQGSEEGKGWYARLREIQKDINTKKQPREKLPVRRRAAEKENIIEENCQEKNDLAP